MALAVKIDAGIYDPLPDHFSEPLKQFVSWLLTLDRTQRPFCADIMNHEHVEFQSLISANTSRAEQLKNKSNDSKTKVWRLSLSVNAYFMI
jgi:hypothetical protein